MTRASLRSGPLSLDEALALVTHPGAGGIATFLGVVRDHNEGLPTTLLEYEAYPAMAVAEMERIVAAIEGEIPGVRLAVQHRVGPLQIGDAAVLCAASAPPPRRGLPGLPPPHRSHQGARPHLEARARPRRASLGQLARRAPPSGALRIEHSRGSGALRIERSRGPGALHFG